MSFLSWLKTKKNKDAQQDDRETLARGEKEVKSYFDLPIGLTSKAQKIAQWNDSNDIKAFAPTPSGVATDSDDSRLKGGELGLVNHYVYNHFIAKCSFIGYRAMAVMSQHWLINKGCQQKVRDSLKRGYEILVSSSKTLDPDEQESVLTVDRKINLTKELIEAVSLKNVFGVRHLFFKHKDPDFDYSNPFVPEDFKEGNYVGIHQIDPYYIVPEFDNLNLLDPFSDNYYEPEYWLIMGRRVHKSHMVILRGEEVPSILKPTYRYGGISLVQRVYERVYSSDTCADESAKLMLTKRTNVRKLDLQVAFANPFKFQRMLSEINSYKDNHGTLIADKEEEIQQLDTALSDVDAVIKGQYDLIASVFDTPVSKLLGTGHAGLSTGETDEDYYLSSCQALQSTDLNDILEAHYLRVSYSLFNENKKISVKWLPMKVISDKEKAETNAIKTQALTNLYNIGAVSQEEIRAVLLADTDFSFNAMGLPDQLPEDYLDEEEEEEEKEQH